ncbi:MAG: glycosyltransferase family 2 protein [Pseudobdellovibrio sp.]
MPNKSSIAITIPCYNESAAIPKFCDEIIEFLYLFKSKMPNKVIKFVFVDNNSKDDSKKMLLEFASKISADQIEVISCLTQGYGAALKAGFYASDADWYGFADLDNTYPLVNFIEMIQTAEEKNHDIIYANRLRLNTGMPILRRLGNLFYSFIAKLLFNNSVNDMCTGMRIFSSRYKKQVINIKSNGLNFSIEFTAITLKDRWNKEELSISYRERVGVSKLSVIKDGFLFLFILLKVRFLKLDGDYTK